MSKAPVSARTFLTVPTLLLLASASPAHAHLGSFAPADGYTLNLYTGTANWCDVTMYNAGAYGTNSGGGPGPTAVVPNSTNWTVLPGAGGFYANAAQRATNYGFAPAYPAAAPGSIPVYIVGDHGPGRTDNSSLAVRNDTPLGSVGALRYDYQIDTYDTGGTVAATVTSGVVSYGIYFSSSPGVPAGSGQRQPQKFHQSLMDSSGNIGLQWGYARDNEIIWRDGPSSAWNYTGLITNGAWDGVSMSLDLTTDTFKLDYYDAVTATTINLAPSGTPMGTAMTNFTSLRWQMEDGENSGVGGKNFFDDASFSIPTPSGVALLGLGGILALRRRRA